MIPPILILKGVNHLHQWYTNTDIPNQYLIGTSDFGYTNNILSIEWIKHFNFFTAARQQDQYRLLIFDGYDSHLTKEFIDYCDLMNIILFTLPPHLSQNLQPFNVVVF